MSNILFDLRDKKAEEHADEFYDKNSVDSSEMSEIDLWDNRKHNFIEGVDWTLSLNIPVLFADWKDESIYQTLTGNYYLKNEEWSLGTTTEELFSYFTDNVLESLLNK